MGTDSQWDENESMVSQKSQTTVCWVQYISIYSMQLFALILFSQIPIALYTG